MSVSQRLNVLNQVWDVGTLSWVRMEQPIIEGDTVVATITGVATSANQSTEITHLSAIQTALQLIDNVGAGTTAGTLRVNVATDNSVTVNNSTLSVIGGGAQSSALRVTLANDSTGVISFYGSSTGSTTSVSGSASSVQLTGADGTRLFCSIFNDSTALLYVQLENSVASTSDFTVRMAPFSYYEAPVQYRGVINGIWASATGNARIMVIIP